MAPSTSGKAGGMKDASSRKMGLYKSMAKVERAEDSKSPKVREAAKAAEKKSMPKRSSGKSR